MEMYNYLFAVCSFCVGALSGFVAAVLAGVRKSEDYNINGHTEEV